MKEHYDETSEHYRIKKSPLKISHSQKVTYKVTRIRKAFNKSITKLGAEENETKSPKLSERITSNFKLYIDHVCGET